MSHGQSTPTRTPSYYALALEHLSDDAAALQAELKFARAETEAYRDLALEALAELHDALVERDQLRAAVAVLERRVLEHESQGSNDSNDRQSFEVAS